MNAPVNLPIVRGAHPHDFMDIMGMCEELYAENGITNVNWGRVQQAVMDGINGNLSTLAVIGPPQDLRGMILLRFAETWYSDQPILEELYNFVPKPHRKGHNARALIEFAKNAADRLDMPLLIGVLSSHRTRAKVRLYRKFFGEPTGAFFLYNGRTGRT